MKLLIHTCCGPCLTGSRIPFEEENIELTAFYFNPNIHPYVEYDRRLQTLQRYLFVVPMGLIICKDYPYKNVIKNMLDLELSEVKEFNHVRPKRCSYCYELRLKRTAEMAIENGYDAFTSTMLLSKHQDHKKIKMLGERISKEMDIHFEYRDLREYWKRSIEISRKLRMYRQQYCGCIFSESERFQVN